MGYSMSQRESEFFIPADKVIYALQAIKDLHGKETILDASGRHFAGVARGFFMINSFEQMMYEWGWEIAMDEDLNVIALNCMSDKLGDETFLFEAIAPVVQAGSYIDMCGEDGSQWRWLFCPKVDGLVVVSRCVLVEM